MADKQVNMFFAASSKGDIAALEQLFTSAALSMTDADGKNALHFAAMDGKVESIEWLIQKGFAVDSLTKKGLTPFHFSVYKGHKTSAQLLAAAGCDTTLADATGRTALHLACVAGSLELVQWLVYEAGCSLDDVNNEGMGAAHFASLFGHVAIVEWIASGASAAIDGTTHAGMTCMHVAAMKGQLDVIQWLAAPLPNGGGLTVGQGDLKKRTPLHLAVVSQHPDTVRFLIEAGADARQADAEGKTPVTLAAGIMASGPASGGAAERVRDFLVAATSPPAPPMQCCIVTPQIMAELGLVVEDGEVPPECVDDLAPKLPAPGHGVTPTRAWVRWDAPDVPAAGKAAFEYSVQVASRMQARMGMGWSDAVLTGMSASSTHSESRWGESTVNTTPFCFACISGLASGRDYSFRVRARNINGWGAFSKADDFVTPKADEGGPTPASQVRGAGAETQPAGSGEGSVPRTPDKSSADSNSNGLPCLTSTGATPVQPTIAMPVNVVPDPTLPQAVVDAASQGDVTALDAAEQAGLDVRGVDAQGRTMLHYASQAGFMSAVKWGVARGIPVDARDRFGASALLLAVVAGQLPATRALALAGGAVDTADIKGYSALHYAALKGRVAVFRWLCEAGADPTVKNSKGQSVKALLDQRLGIAAQAPSGAPAAVPLTKDETAQCQYMLTMLANAENVPAAPPAPSFVESTRYSIFVNLPAAKWVQGCPAPFAFEMQYTRRAGLGLGLSPFWSTASESLPTGINIYSPDYLQQSTLAGASAAAVSDVDPATQSSESSAAANNISINRSGGGSAKAGWYTLVTTVISGLQPDSRYVAQVRARNARGWGPWSARTGDMATKLSSDKHVAKAEHLLAANASQAAANLLSSELNASGARTASTKGARLPLSVYHRPAEIVADPIAAGIKLEAASEASIDAAKALDLDTGAHSTDLLVGYVDAGEHTEEANAACGPVGMNAIISMAHEGRLLELAGAESGTSGSFVQDMRRLLLQCADKEVHLPAEGIALAAGTLGMQAWKAPVIPNYPAALLTDNDGFACTPQSVFVGAAVAACHAGSTRALHWLVGGPADEDLTSPVATDRASLSHLPASNVKALVLLNAAAAAEDQDGRGLLHAAAVGGHIGMLRFVISGLAGISSSTSDDNVRPMLASLVKGAVTNSGATAVHLAALGGDADCLGWLLSLQAHDGLGSKGTDLATHAAAVTVSKAAEKDTSNGWSVLHYAACGGSHTCVHLLVEDMRISAATQDAGGRSAAHLAAAANSAHILRFLADRDVSLLSAIDAGGLTPLHYAAASDSVLSALFLIKCGVPLHAKDAAGRSAVDVAVKAGSVGCAAVFQSCASASPGDWHFAPSAVTATRSSDGEVAVSWLQGRQAALHLIKLYTGGIISAVGIRHAVETSAERCLGPELDSLDAAVAGENVKVQWAVRKAALEPAACFIQQGSNIGVHVCAGRGPMDLSSRIERLTGVVTSQPVLVRISLCSHSSEVLASSDIVWVT